MEITQDFLRRGVCLFLFYVVFPRQAETGTKQQKQKKVKEEEKDGDGDDEEEEEEEEAGCCPSIR